MPRILIVYGSTYGQTAKVAERLRELLVAQGCEVVLRRGDRLPPDLTLADYDGALVGASLIAGRYQRFVQRFVEEHRAGLNRIPSGFFAVSGSAGSPRPRDRAAAERAVELFLVRTGWNPVVRLSLAGAMAYSRYNPFLRFFMRRIARKSGETDTRHDREYTDWGQVARFAEAFVGMLPRQVPVRRPDYVIY